MTDSSSSGLRFAARVLLAPHVWLPIAAGSLGVLAFDGVGEMLAWGAVAVGVALALYRFTLGRQAIWQQIQDHGVREAGDQHREYLRQLQRRLRDDGDSRTGQLVQRLRSLHQRLTQRNASQSPDTALWMKQLDQQLNDVYAVSVGALERSLALWQTAQAMGTPESRDQVLKTREQVLEQVDQTVLQLERSLDQAQVIQVEQRLPSDELKRLRDELTQGIQVARQIQDRMDQLERDLAGVRTGLSE